MADKDNKRSGLTAEERHLNFEMQKAEARERNKARVQTRTKQKCRSVYTETNNLKGKTTDQKLDALIKLIADKIIKDGVDWHSMPTDPTNKNVIFLRRQLLSLIKDEAAVIKTFVDVQAILKDIDATQRVANTDSDENIMLFADAKKKLSKLGIKV